MQASCQCGAVTFTTPTPKPLRTYFCHCTECRKQSASAFGTSAVFPATEPLFPLSESLRDRLGIFTRSTDAGNTLDCYFCKTCGVRMFHRARTSDGKEKDTFNMKMGVLEGLDMRDVTEHIWTKSAVIEIPPGAQTWPTGFDA